MCVCAREEQHIDNKSKRTAKMSKEKGKRGHGRARDGNRSKAALPQFYSQTRTAQRPLIIHRGEPEWAASRFPFSGSPKVAAEQRAQNGTPRAAAGQQEGAEGAVGEAERE